MKNEILDKIYRKKREGVKPTHIILSYDMYSSLRAKFDPIECEFIPNEYSKDLRPDSIFGLTMAVLTSSSIENYMEVV